VVDPRQPQGVAGDVDGAGVPAPGQHHQAPVPDVDDEGLVVDDQRGGLPPPVPVGLVHRQAPLRDRRAGRPPRREPAAVPHRRRPAPGRAGGARWPPPPRPPGPPGRAGGAPRGPPPGGGRRRGARTGGGGGGGGPPRPRGGASPATPPAWSKCPWLSTTASIA